MGAIAPARPIWCENLEPGISTHVAGTSSWVDDFNHGQSMASFNPADADGFVGNGGVSGGNGGSGGATLPSGRARAHCPMAVRAADVPMAGNETRTTR